MKDKIKVLKMLGDLPTTPGLIKYLSELMTDESVNVRKEALLSAEKHAKDAAVWAMIVARMSHETDEENKALAKTIRDKVFSIL